MGSATTPAARDASLDDVRVFTYKLMPTCMLALLAAFITSTLIYTINLQQPLPKKVALSISFLFLAFLIIFAGGALILHFSYRAARRKSLDVERDSDAAVRADSKVSLRTKPLEVPRNEPGVVPGRGLFAQDEHLPRPQQHHEQNPGIGNRMHDPRRPPSMHPDDRRNQPHRGARDSIERYHTRQADRHQSVHQQVEPQQPVPRQVDAHRLSSNPQPSYGPGHDARHTLPSIRVTAPTPPLNYWPAGSDHTFGQKPGSSFSRPWNDPSHPQNRPSHTQDGSSGPQGGKEPQGPHSLPTSANERRTHNPRIHLSRHPDISPDARDILTLLLHLINDKDGSRLRNVLLAMDTKTRERHSVADEKAMPPEYKSATCGAKDETAKDTDDKPPSNEKKRKLSEPDDKPPLPEKDKLKTKTRTRRQKSADQEEALRRIGAWRKLRGLDRPVMDRVLVEDVASGPGDGEISPKTKGRPDGVGLVESGEWTPVDDSTTEGCVFEGRGTGGAERGVQQAGQRRPGRCEGKETDRAEDDWSGGSDYEEGGGKKA